jgi:hypothetical protein
MAGKGTALIPIEQRTVEFHGDTLTAVLVSAEGGAPVIYVPVRPLCQFLGLNWSGQRQRLMRDPVLAEVAKGVVVTHTPFGRGGAGPQEMLCLPLEFLHGWLFGVDVRRVRPELQDRLNRYRRECFGILWRAFQAGALGTASPAPDTSPLGYVRGIGLALVTLAEQQQVFEGRLVRSDRRLDQAALVVGDMRKRLVAVERKLAGGSVVTEGQAAEIALAVKALAMLLTEREPGKDHYGGVYGELYRRFGVTSYHNIRADRFAEVLAFLEEWRRRVAGEQRSDSGTGQLADPVG